MDCIIVGNWEEWNFNMDGDSKETGWSTLDDFLNLATGAAAGLVAGSRVVPTLHSLHLTSSLLPRRWSLHGHGAPSLPISVAMEQRRCRPPLLAADVRGFPAVPHLSEPCRRRPPSCPDRIEIGRAHV